MFISIGRQSCAAYTALSTHAMYACETSLITYINQVPRQKYLTFAILNGLTLFDLMVSAMGNMIYVILKLLI